MGRMHDFPVFVLLIAAVGSAGCSAVSSNREGIPSPARTVSLVAGDGSGRGFVAVREGAGGAILSLNVEGLPAGAHGLHLHEKGTCDGPAFASAGGHWNPTARQHGRDNPAGAHLGDLANLDVAASGKGTAILSVPSAAMMADRDGTALVVHAKADDYRTDPSGSSGDRVACAVIAPPR